VDGIYFQDDEDEGVNAVDVAVDTSNDSTVNTTDDTTIDNVTNANTTTTNDQDDTTPSSIPTINNNKPSSPPSFKLPSSITISTAARARAHHRRAKAMLALNQYENALDDARTAAFLGDRNAVSFYGRLMRGSNNENGSLVENSNESKHEQFASILQSSSNNDNTISSNIGNGNGGIENSLSSNDIFASLLSSATSSPSYSSSPFSNNNGILGQQHSNSNNNNNNIPPINPFEALGSLSNMMNGMGTTTTSPTNNNNNNGGAGGGIAESMITNMIKTTLSTFTKRIEDETTQQNICTYLQSITIAQLSNIVSMTGIPIPNSLQIRIVTFANNVTPISIQKYTLFVKRLIYIGTIVKKILKVISKYKHIIVFMFVMVWIKSSLLRPVVTTSRRAAKKALKMKALNE